MMVYEEPKPGDPCARCGLPLHQMTLTEDSLLCTKCGWPGLDRREDRHLKLKISFDADRFHQTFQAVDAETGQVIRIQHFALVGDHNGVTVTLVLARGFELEATNVPVVVTDKIAPAAERPHPKMPECVCSGCTEFDAGQDADREMFGDEVEALGLEDVGCKS